MEFLGVYKPINACIWISHLFEEVQKDSLS